MVSVVESTLSITSVRVSGAVQCVATCGHWTISLQHQPLRYGETQPHEVIISSDYGMAWIIENTGNRESHSFALGLVANQSVFHDPNLVMSYFYQRLSALVTVCTVYRCPIPWLS